MVSRRELILSNSRVSIDLYPWLKLRDTEEESIQALEGILGFGFPDQTNQFFEGSSSTTYRGSRLRPRDIDLPLVISGADRESLNAQLSTLYTALNSRYGMSRLSYMAPDGDLWHVDVIRQSGGDYSRERSDTDLEKTLKLKILTLRAPSPLWTRSRPESFRLEQDNTGRGLLPYLAKLEVSSAGAFGRREVLNVGDEDAWPIWTMKGPFTNVRLVGPEGEVLEWTGSILAGNGLVIDSMAATVRDFNGVNRYDGLSAAPRFWAIAPGSSQVSVEMSGTSGGTVIPGDPDKVVGRSQILAEWRPRRGTIV